MQKTTWKNLRDKSNAERGAILFLAFCRSLDQYCEEIGVEAKKFGAAHILHEAAINTLHKKHTFSAAEVREMNIITQRIPEIIQALLMFTNTHGYLRNVARMSKMSLDEVLVQIGAARSR